MKPNDVNLVLLTSVVRTLGPLSDRFVFVGGCVTGLLVTDLAAAPARTTNDVDAIVEVMSRTEYRQLELELEQAGFAHDLSPDAPLCRWVGGRCLLDVMPTDPTILGFGNLWHARAMNTAEKFELPGGQEIRLITPPLFLATKFEAFKDRGNGDYLGSHDLEDIVTVIDGRAKIVDEVGVSDSQLRDYLGRRFADLLGNSAFREALPGHLPGDPASQARVGIVEQRMQAMSEPRDFSSRESERLDRVVRIRTLAREIFSTDAAVAAWMNLPDPALDNKTPSEVLATESGIQKVESLLRAGMHGVPR